MRLLHVGSGFRPWRRGGLVAYVEDLMAEQARRGEDVAYFFAGRQYPLRRGPRLRRWDRDGVAMLEVVDSPLYDHGRQPELEVAEPRVEALFAQVLREVGPDLVHVHELAGLPSSVLDTVADAGVPLVVTLQDYFPLCPAFKLVDADGRLCLRREVGADCVATTAADPRPAGLLIGETLGFHVRRAALRRGHGTKPFDPLIKAVGGAVGSATARALRDGARDAAAFQRRRELNVARLNRADRVIAMSHRVGEIYAQLGVDEQRLQTVHLTLAHLERLNPRPPRDPAAPLTFATLAGFESRLKGGDVLLEALRALAGRARVLVFGHIAPRYAQAAAGLPGVELRGLYVADELDAMLDEVDVGIVPSVWEEAYAYAGVEFLAKGIPVIANAIGGMPDYTRDDETGWLNRSCAAPELAAIMGDLAEHPEHVDAVAAKVRAARDELVKPLARHAEEMDVLYREIIAARTIASA